MARSNLERFAAGELPATHYCGMVAQPKPEARDSQVSGEVVLTLAEAADRARVSTKTLYRAAGSGEGPFYKVGAQWRVDASALSDWMHGREQGAVGKSGTGVLAEVEAIRKGTK